MSRVERKELLSNVRYFHYAVKGGGWITAAVTVPSTAVLLPYGYIAIAFCSPKDDFDEQAGQWKAMQRLSHGLRKCKEEIQVVYTDGLILSAICSVIDRIRKPYWLLSALYTGPMPTNILTAYEEKSKRRLLFAQAYRPQVLWLEDEISGYDFLPKKKPPLLEVDPKVGDIVQLTIYQDVLLTGGIPASCAGLTGEIIYNGSICFSESCRVKLHDPMPIDALPCVWARMGVRLFPVCARAPALGEQVRFTTNCAKQRPRDFSVAGSKGKIVAYSGRDGMGCWKHGLSDMDVAVKTNGNALLARYGYHVYPIDE